MALLHKSPIVFDISPRKFLILHPLRLNRIWPQTPHLVFFISLEVAFEPFDMGVALEGQNMGAKAVKEKPVVRNYHRASGEIFDGGL